MKQTMVILAFMLAAGSQRANAQDTTSIKKGKWRIENGRNVMTGIDKNNKPYKYVGGVVKKKLPSSSAAKDRVDSTIINATLAQASAPKEKIADNSNHFASGTINPIVIQNTGSGALYVTLANGTATVRSDSQTIAAGFTPARATPVAPDPDSMLVLSKSFKGAVHRCGEQTTEPDLDWSYMDFSSSKTKFRHKEKKRFAQTFQTCEGLTAVLHIMRANDTSILSTSAVNLFNTKDGIAYVKKGKDGKWHASFAEGEYNVWKFTQEVRLVYERKHRKDIESSSLPFASVN